MRMACTYFSNHVKHDFYVIVVACSCRFYPLVPDTLLSRGFESFNLALHPVDALLKHYEGSEVGSAAKL